MDQQTSLLHWECCTHSCPQGTITAGRGYLKHYEPVTTRIFLKHDSEMERVLQTVSAVSQSCIHSSHTHYCLTPLLLPDCHGHGAQVFNTKGKKYQNLYKSRNNWRKHLLLTAHGAWPSSRQWQECLCLRPHAAAAAAAASSLMCSVPHSCYSRRKMMTASYSECKLQHVKLFAQLSKYLIFRNTPKTARSRPRGPLAL
jgi:hypothetical protein